MLINFFITSLQFFIVDFLTDVWLLKGTKHSNAAYKDNIKNSETAKCELAVSFSPQFCHLQN